MHPVAYAVRSGPNEELRYSLRSLANLPHSEVVIAGDPPEWVTGCTVIRQKPTGKKYQRAGQNWLRIAESLSKPFIAMHDDMFVMRPIEYLPVWHRGPLAERIEATSPGGYRNGMIRTLSKLQALGIREPLSYHLHLPMLIHPLEWQAMVHHLPEWDTLHLRTMYGNLFELGGEQREDVKGDQVADLDFLSTSDRGFRSGPRGRQIRGAFPDRSPFEV